MTKICPLCDGVQPIALTSNEKVGRCVSCQALLFDEGSGPRVLIAHASEAMSTYLGTVLAETGFSPVRTPNGSEGLKVLSRHSIPAAVVDVALDNVTAFEFIDAVKQNAALKNTKIVLLASVFRRTAYKRKPTSLYGAHDYVEQHHIHDALPVKLRTLMGLPLLAVAAMERSDGAAASRAADRPELSGGSRVKALAHGIVADIALYRQAAIEEAAQSWNYQPLDESIVEGRQILASMVSPVEYAGTDPILEAFLELLEKVRRNA